MNLTLVYETKHHIQTLKKYKAAADAFFWRVFTAGRAGGNAGDARKLFTVWRGFGGLQPLWISCRAVH